MRYKSLFVTSPPFPLFRVLDITAVQVQDDKKISNVFNELFPLRIPTNPAKTGSENQ